MASPELYEKIENYLKGRLSDEEHQTFARRAESDPELAREVALHRDMIEAIADEEVLAFRQRMEAVAGKIRETDTDSEYRSGATFSVNRQDSTSGDGSSGQSARTFSLKRSLAVAATILILITIGIVWMTGRRDTSPEALFAQHIDYPESLELTTRSDDEGSELEQAWWQAGQFYQEGQYRQALDALSRANSIDPSFENHSKGGFYYYQGIFLLKLDQPAVAINAFGQALGSPVFGARAKWSRALAFLIIDGQKEQAKATLQELIDEGHPKKEEAEKILSALE